MTPVRLGALAGAGPAYVARFVDALAKAGEGRGLGEGREHEVGAGEIAVEVAGVDEDALVALFQVQAGR